MSDPRDNIADFLPGMLGPLEIQVNGTPYGKPTHIVWNWIGVTITDDPTYLDPETGAKIGRTVFTFAGGEGGAAPTDTGFATVTGGAFDAAATPNLKYAGGRLQTSVPIDFKSGTKIGSLSWTPTNTRAVVIPDASGQIVLRDTTDTLTNKTIDLAGAGANTLKSTGASVGDVPTYDGTKFVASAPAAGGAPWKFAGDVTVTNPEGDSDTVFEADIADAPTGNAGARTIFYPIFGSGTLSKMRVFVDQVDGNPDCTASVKIYLNDDVIMSIAGIDAGDGGHTLEVLLEDPIPYVDNDAIRVSLGINASSGAVECVFRAVVSVR